MNSSTLNNQQKQQLQEILTRIKNCFSSELNIPISNSYNIAMNFSLIRPWNQMNQTYRKLTTDTDSFIKNLTTSSIQTLKNYQQNSSKSLNQIQTMFKSMSNQFQNKVAAHQQAKKKNPYAVGPTKAVITQSQEVFAAFFTHFKKVILQFQSINEKFIQKGKKNDPNLKGFMTNSNNQAFVEALETIKQQVQFLYKDLYGSFQTATYLGLGRLWNQMMQTYQQFSDMTNGIVKNKGSYSEKIVDQYYQKAMKSAYDIHSSIKQMMDEVEKKKNTPSCSNSLIIEAQNCQASVLGYLQKIRNQLNIIKNKYPNIKESNFQGFKKQPQLRKLQIQLVFKGLDQFMQDSKLQELLDVCVRQYLAIEQTKQKLIEIKYEAGKMKIILQISGVLQSQIQIFKGELKRNLQTLIDFNQFDNENSKVLKKIQGAIQTKFALFESRNGRIILISKANQIKQQIASINKEINKNLKSTIKDFYLKQKSQLNFSKKFLENKLKQSQFQEIQVRFDEGRDLKITFFGQLLFVNQLINSLQEFIQTLQGKIFDYNLSLNEQELSIIQKDQQLKKQVETNWNFSIKYNRNQIVPAQINIKPHSSLGSNLPQKQILFQTYFNLDSLPKNSVLFLKNKKQLQTIKRPCILPFKKLLQQTYSKNPNFTDNLLHKDQERGLIYFYTNQLNPLQILLQSKDNKILKNAHVFMYMPQTKNFKLKIMKLIQKICQTQDLIKSQLKITFICKKNHDIQSILGLNEGKNSCKPQMQRKWFAIDNKNKLFYSQKGNQKIQNALQKKLNQVQLTNEDLNLQVPTHSFDFKKNLMTHTVTGKQFPITVHPNKITFQLYGLEKTIPDSEYKKIPRNQGTKKLQNCQLSIGFYHIDLANKIQTNLFSVYQRKIDCQYIVQNSQIYNFTIQYDIKKNNLVLQYPEQNSKYIQKAVGLIKQNLNKRLIEITLPFDKDFTVQLICKFSSDAKQQNIKTYFSNDKKSAVFKAYNDKNIKNFIKMLSFVRKIPIQFPKQWQPQTQQIQTFIVPKNTIQFLNVQKAFTVGNIVELVRIQNKLIFKKYYEEKLCLQQLNGGKQIKQMLLYHGTRYTDPKLIYEDKQQSFNINYTSDRNLLGKGIYFAQKSQYSSDYQYEEDSKKGINSMFYCRVLAGDSQKCPKLSGEYRDTDFKDTVNKIRYESMTEFLNGSNVFVVYKNRRAYPSYLIKYTKK